MSVTVEVDPGKRRLSALLAGSSALLSIDVDFFTLDAERRSAAALVSFVRSLSQRGVALSYNDDHVALTELSAFPIEVVINFDFHMDCRKEYLFGDAPKTPPDNATVFEDLLSVGRISRYVWAMPTARYREVSTLYGEAVLAQRQPTLSRIHCVSDTTLLAEILSCVAIAHVFICRSPEYGSSFTDSLYAELIDCGRADV